jgi:tRNA threonylcarbamoyladenosine biosynthesis protein TsaB
MRVLAIDTAFDACSAAIVDGEETLWIDQRIIGRGHAEVLPLMVADGLAATGLGVADLDRVGVVIGPGAFAGIRVGLAFARGLCLGTGVSAVGVTSLRALAESVGARGPVAAIFDARRGQVYAALFDGDGKEFVAPFVAAPEAAAARLAGCGAMTVAGSGAMLVAPFMTAQIITADVRVIDPVAVARFAAASPAPAGPPSPLYLRPPDAAPQSGSIFAGKSAP